LFYTFVITYLSVGWLLILIWNLFQNKSLFIFIIIHKSYLINSVEIKNKHYFVVLVKILIQIWTYLNCFLNFLFVWPNIIKNKLKNTAQEVNALLPLFVSTIVLNWNYSTLQCTIIFTNSLYIFLLLKNSKNSVG